MSGPDAREQANLDALRSIPVAPMIDEMTRMGYPWMLMRDVRSRTPGKKLVGRAVTLRYLPPRADVKEEVGYGTNDAPEYRAYDLCGPGRVLVIDAMGLTGEPGVIGGDVKLHRLKQRGAEGLVTDGVVRDIADIREYGYGVFSRETSLAAGPTIGLAYGINEVVQCGGVLVRPGDYLVEEGAEHSRLEGLLKALMDAGDVSPGLYYPLTKENRKRLKDEVARRGLDV